MFRPVLRFVSLLITAACGVPDTMEKPGTTLPEFSLQDHLGNTVTRADLLGKRTVLWFYPKADTPG